MRSATAILARLAAAALILAAGVPAPVLAREAQAVPPAPAACLPTALAIQKVAAGGVSLSFLPIGPFDEEMSVEGLAGDLHLLLPSITMKTARDFSGQLKAGDGGTYSLTCDWAGLGVAIPRDGGLGLRIAHPLISADGREALVMIQQEAQGRKVDTCHLQGGPSAWVVIDCQSQDF